MTELFLSPVTVGESLWAVTLWIPVALSDPEQSYKFPEKTDLSEEKNQGQKIESHRGVHMQILR